MVSDENVTSFYLVKAKGAVLRSLTADDGLYIYCDI